MVRTRTGKNNKRITTLCITSFVLLFIFIVFSPNGLLRYYRLQQSLKTVQAANEELRKQNEELRAEIDKLKNDPEYLEEVARKKFGLIKKNELIFNFKKKKK